MKAWLIRQLRALLVWLEPPGPDVLCDAARVHMQAQNRYSDRRGDHKRRVVLNELRQIYPEVRPRDLALAIERVMQELP